VEKARDELSTAKLVIRRALVKKGRIDLHEELESVVDHSVDGSEAPRDIRRSAWQLGTRRRTMGSSPVPVSLRVLEKRGEDDREDNSNVVSHEVDNVFVVPVI
jgi:hypothetical protein